MHDLPKALQDAMERLLEADADLETSHARRSNVERIDALRAARALIADWRRGTLDVHEAVRRLDALVNAGREV